MTELFENLVFVFQRLTLISLIDLFLVTVIFSILLFFLKNTQAMLLVRGILFLMVLVTLLSLVFDLPAFSWLITTTLPALILAIPVIFAPEIRRFLARLGRAGDLVSTRRLGANGSQDVIDKIVHAAGRLSSRRHGALIVIRRNDTLDEYKETGVILNADLSAELLMQIFYPNTPLHDGAVILEDGIISAASCVMPLSASGVLSITADRKMGLRHRAALGASEIGDNVALVVSEETGAISISTNGRMIHRLDIDRLEGVLRAIYKPSEPQHLADEFATKISKGWQNISFRKNSEREDMKTIPITDREEQS